MMKQIRNLQRIQGQQTQPPEAGEPPRELRIIGPLQPFLQKIVGDESGIVSPPIQGKKAAGILPAAEGLVKAEGRPLQVVGDTQLLQTAALLR